MNQFKTSCPNCKTELTVPSTYQEKTVKCGGCQSDFLATPLIEAPVIAVPIVTPNPTNSVSNKEQITSEYKIVQPAILCFLFGGLGLHAFFTKNRSQGMILLGLTIVGAILYFGMSSYRGIGAMAMLASYVFALGDLVRLLMGKYKDGEGKLMTTWN